MLRPIVIGRLGNWLLELRSIPRSLVEGLLLLARTLLVFRLRHSCCASLSTSTTVAVFTRVSEHVDFPERYCTTSNRCRSKASRIQTRSRRCSRPSQIYSPVPAQARPQLRRCLEKDP